jgi:hypothetical protein
MPGPTASWTSEARLRLQVPSVKKRRKEEERKKELAACSAVVFSKLNE